MPSPDASAHAEQMDDIYGGIQRHIYDVTRKYYLLGRDSLIAALQPGEGQNILEVGCGTARNSIVAARQFPQARFFGFDISSAMLASASKSVAKAGLDERIALTQGDATDFQPQSAFGIAKFDRVFCSYTLSMIPDWQATIRNSLSLLADGGELLIVDFGDQHGWPGFFRRMLYGWLARFQVTPRTELGDFCQQLAVDHGVQCKVRQRYRGYAIMITITNTGFAGA
ncbi:MAG: class I SAM-dependent methyltransferase [Pseudomonadota bacterium]